MDAANPGNMMNVNTERLVAKRDMWDHVAIEFNYSCAACGRRPTLDDSDPYLLTGYCRSCWTAAPRQPAAAGHLPSHL